MNFVLSVVSLFFLIFTSIFGIYCLVELVAKKLFDEKDEKTGIHIIKAVGDGESLEWKVRMSQKTAEKIILLDIGLNAEGLALAKKIEQEKNNIRLAVKDELLSVINEQG